MSGSAASISSETGGVPQTTAHLFAGQTPHAELHAAYMGEAIRLRCLAAKRAISLEHLGQAVLALARESPVSAQHLIFWLLADTRLEDRWLLWQCLGQLPAAFVMEQRAFPEDWVAERYKELADSLYNHVCAGTCTCADFNDAARRLECAHPLSAMYLKGLLIEKLGGPGRFIQLLSMTGRPIATQWMFLHVIGRHQPAVP